MNTFKRTFAIGDIQGCLTPLQELLEHIKFDKNTDQLWFCGDLINRGPESLETLRFIRDLGDNAISVLGNHDLHFLAVAEDLTKPRPKDTFDALLNAHDRDELVQWLRHRPLCHLDKSQHHLLVHAGLYPAWTVDQAASLAAEAEAVLRGSGYRHFLANMYGNEPECWDDNYEGLERIRFIVNAFTRMRFCTPSLALELTEKGAPGSQPGGLIPWFDHADLNTDGVKVLFGHWSTMGESTSAHVIPLDTGCVWGGDLTLYHLETQKLHCVHCSQQQKPGDP